MPYYLVRHKVQDYAKWKPIFDQHGATRQVCGHRGGQLFRNADDHNELLILWEVGDLEKARQFLQSEDLRQTMQLAGVADQPDIYLLSRTRSYVSERTHLMGMQPRGGVPVRYLFQFRSGLLHPSKEVTHKGEYTMSTEDNKALVRRWYEDFNQRNLAMYELFSPDYVYHNPPTTLHGLEEFKQFLSLYLTAFPDARFTVEDELAEGDQVASRSTLRGTHQGEFMGIPPTGKPVTVTGIAIDRIVGGKFVEGWLNFDALGMLQQLGVIPALGQASE